MKTILVPLDGSAVSEQVLPLVRSLAPILRARVHLLTVITHDQRQHLIAHLAATQPESLPDRDQAIPIAATESSTEQAQF